MADGYKGKDHMLNRYVAIKVLKKEFREDETFVRKFRSEAQAAAGLLNPNIVNVYDVGEDRGLYYIVMERYRSNSDYAILVFHDRYDIPAKGSDGERQWESEEVFEYMICAICPLAGEYEPGKPVCGFLFPAFVDRSGDPSRIDVFQMDADRPHKELMEILGI